MEQIELAELTQSVDDGRVAAELAGTSSTTTVSLTALGPLTAGVSYEFWLVGHNSRGDGPESDHVTHVAV
ncbi:MAG: fibronectin type III domain-containing protein [Planctomycetota bacterium]|nr:fibronectin type III domain-containing protein [Planctomycetota bacterium]